jgi:polysaccharide deacetylase 2 family uncharacterized protein YibQ
MPTPLAAVLKPVHRAGALVCMGLLCSCTTPAPVEPALCIQPPPPDRQIYLIIDDAGQKRGQIDSFLNLPAALTVAVLPGCLDTRNTARKVVAHAPKKQLILHQPMQPINPAIDPGPGAIYIDTPVDEVAPILQQNIAQVPGAQGMNNHMGSLVTQNRERLEATMAFCKTNNLFFIDSFTIPTSIAGQVARECGVPTAQQNVFLDNDRSAEAITRQFKKGMRIAAERGFVVMIGHAWSPNTAKVIGEMYPQATADGYSFHIISDVFEPSTQAL